MSVTLSLLEARRLAVAFQGFSTRPSKPSITHLRKLARRLHAFQIDSVNVLVRAHYVPAFARLGPYRREALDELAYGKRELFEGTWAAWLYGVLHPQVQEIVVCNPRRNALLKEGSKSDKIDARKLAELLRSECCARFTTGRMDFTNRGRRATSRHGWRSFATCRLYANNQLDYSMSISPLPNDLGLKGGPR